MKLATMANGGRDGLLVRVSDDLTRMIPCDAVVPTLQAAVERWDTVAPQLRRLDPTGPNGRRFDPSQALAPLPRAWQWLDASAFSTHGMLMQKAYDLPPLATNPPLMYQGMSHEFISSRAPVRLPDEAHGIDFEAEYAVITGEVSMGATPAETMQTIRLVLLLNDWSLRVLGAEEMRTGFGWVRAKPACSLAPVAVTPDQLGEAWRDGRVHLPVLVDFRGDRFGAANGGAMEFGFHELIAHAAATRDLCAGTIIGSGTISNPDYAQVGSSCIAERRAIEAITHGKPATPFMRYGERVRIEVLQEAASVFGDIEQTVTQLPARAGRTASTRA
jgi:fumarylacetoacetate (FAA) hydrolase